VNKVKCGQRERIVQCDYCNVCKTLDGTHKPVICALWPQGALQAPKEAAMPEALDWGVEQPVTLKAGATEVALRWKKLPGVLRYEIHRRIGDAPAELVEATKVGFWTDHTVLGGLRYAYQVRACMADGRTSALSPPVGVTLPLPGYMAALGSD
jgi:hypothetical protein